MKVTFILYVLASCIVFVIGFFIGKKQLDIQLHDTYLVVDYFCVIILVCFLLGLNAVIFRHFHKERKADRITILLSFLHFIVSLVMFFHMFFPLSLPSPMVSDVQLVSIKGLDFYSIGMILLSILLLVIIYFRSEKIQNFDRYAHIIDE